MELQITTIYYFADETLKANRFFDDTQVKMTTAEVITIALTAARFFATAHKVEVKPVMAGSLLSG